MRNWAPVFRPAARAAVLVGLSFLPLASLPTRVAQASMPAASPVAASPADAAAAAKTATPEQLARLIQQLGSGSFVEREQASRELTELGIAAREALTTATQSPDAEVRNRARHILAEVTAADFQARLDAFSADYDGLRQQTLPGWEQFSARFGTHPLARQLFVEMQRAEPDLLDALTQGGKQASEVLDERCQAIVQQIMLSRREAPPALGTIASFLFVGATEGVNVDEQMDMQLYTWMISHPVFQKSARTGGSSALLKKLLGSWVLKDANSAVTVQNLLFAASFDMKPEALSLSTRVVAEPKIAASTRQYAVLMLGRYGNKEHFEVLEKLLDDQSPCNAAGGANPPRQVELQIRDVALAVLVHMTGQKLRDYGYFSAQPNQATLYQAATLTFVGPAQREAALKKWARWRSEHPAG